MAALGPSKGAEGGGQKTEVFQPNEINNIVDQTGEELLGLSEEVDRRLDKFSPEEIDRKLQDLTDRIPGEDEVDRSSQEAPDKREVLKGKIDQGYNLPGIEALAEELEVEDPIALIERANTLA